MAVMAWSCADSSPALTALLALITWVLKLRRTKRFRNRFLSAALATLLPDFLLDTYSPFLVTLTTFHTELILDIILLN
jgi:hypothetical protein